MSIWITLEAGFRCLNIWRMCRGQASTPYPLLLMGCSEPFLVLILSPQEVNCIFNYRYKTEELKIFLKETFFGKQKIPNNGLFSK